jgi:hypothetical protein
MLDSIAAAIGVKKGVALAAFVGALIATLIGPKREWRERAVTFIVGFAAAVYLTHPTITYFELNAEAYEGGVGFMLGCFAMTITDKTLMLIRDLDFSAVSSIFKKGK